MLGDDSVEKEIKIETEFIKLDQLLKFIGLTQTGGHSKMLIQEGLIKVNDEICLQRGRKIKKNDKIIIEGEGSFIII